MKKLLGLMLALGLVAVGVGACGTNDTAPPASPAPEASPAP